MRLFPCLLAVLALAHIEASPVTENDVAPEKKSMRSMDRSYFRDVLPWRGSYNKWFKRSGPEEKRSMMSMDRAMQKPISLRPVSNSWWGKRSMWSMDRANQRNARFLKRSQAVDKQAIIDYLHDLWGVSDSNNDAVTAEDINALLEQVKEESDQEIHQTEGDHGRVKRGEPFIPAMGAPSPPINIFSRGLQIKH